MTLEKTADAEQSKRTGGMLALWPSPESASQLVLPGGEPLDDLHVTLAFLGEDVGHLSSVYAQRILDEEGPYISKLTVRAFGHATFNPDGEVGDPCAVYLLGNSPTLAYVQNLLLEKLIFAYGELPQHLPWIPHITAGYGREAQDLTYTGDIVLDRLVLKWQGDTYAVPLS